MITGRTSRIGYGLARRLLEAGNTVIVDGRRKSLLDKITAEHPGIKSIALDVASPTSITNAAVVLTATYPDLNVVINNAGIMPTEDLRAPGSLQVAEDHMAINLLG
ncbi:MULTISPECIES: SDR family NAD(P)-dependent oxidoreductase [unclassified Rhodococcus (in: high G+C Gram-positive bacteria)]|uniref:SDR family NAD(P)-dependent oxidoreductase n=1 Tax=unclassified Rhodococcus (in: high G+C Gram-positive bacteria) TaxID=192944 RepID=UPI001C52D82D|nr:MULTISPECIES: SDR family NAD(P)-dependent oxidoreductase [unclassified Rhodococcus (in: high G+C Gram-positive bacteria)]